MTGESDYIGRLPRCPTDGAILDEARRLEHGKRECPRCHGVWSPGVIYS